MDDRSAKIYKLVMEGYNQSEAANIVGLSRERVRQILKTEYPDYYFNRKKRLNRVGYETLVAKLKICKKICIAMGISTPDIFKRTGISPSVVTKYLNAYSLYVTPKSRRCKIVVEAVLYLANERMSEAGELLKELSAIK